MSSLENLDLDDNQITNVFSLADLSSIEILDLRDNSVGDVTPLSGLTTLKRYISAAMTTLSATLPIPDNATTPDNW